jgi:thymidine phosphorylase
MQPGTLFYAVGASGVGKDALINGAIRLLQGTYRYELARRAITRPAGNGEDHEPVDDAEFDARLGSLCVLHRPISESGTSRHFGVFWDLVTIGA